MTDKQKTVLNMIEEHFADWFTLSELKEYTEVAPATLTSLVKQGYLERSEVMKNKVYQYRLIGSDLPEEEKVKRDFLMRVNNVDGLLTHLNNSLASWTKQTEELGIEFPKEEYLAWYEKMNGLIFREKEKIKAEYRELTGEDLNHEDSAF